MLTYWRGNVKQPVRDLHAWTSQASADEIYLTSNTLSFTQLAEVMSSHQIVEQTLTLNQTVHGFNGNKSVEQTLTFSQIVSAKNVLAVTPNNFILIRQAVDVVRLTPASNTITFSDTATAVRNKGVTNILALAQSVEVNYFPHNESKSHVLTLTQSATKTAEWPRSVAHTLTLSSSATALKIKYGNANNTFVISQLAEAGIFLRVENTLSFSQTAEQYRIISQSVDNTLELEQELDRTVVYNLTPSSTLTYLHTFFRPTVLNGQYQLVPVSEVIVTKVINRVSFRTKDRAIILRPPELGDGEGTNGKIVLQRTITGLTYAYARRSSLRTIKYTFEVDTYKALEMRRFMLDCLSEPIWLENWKGEIWVGYFMNNPFEFTAKSRGGPCGERFSFDVEFDGERVH